MTGSNEDADAPLSDDQRTALIEAFEANGFATFVLGADRIAFDSLMDYVRKRHVATYTDVDKVGGTVTVSKRPFGSLELG